MSCRRLAMLAAGESHQTPLTRVNGLEEAVEVKGLGDGDVVEMVVMRREGLSFTITLAEGSTALSPKPDWHAFFFRKTAGKLSKPTTIEMVLNG